MTPPSQYQPARPEQFVGKTSRIADLLFKKAEGIKNNDACAKWLFTGPPGIGKSRLAEVLARELAHHPSAIEQLNGQSLSVDLVREWERSLYYKPICGQRWVKVVDEIDASSPAAQNELRTYLDRIKSGTVVIATTNKTLKELPQQLQTRFFPYVFEPVTPAAFADWMAATWGFDRAAALDIAERNMGCVRSALIDCEAHMDSKAL
jgi:DNA polymerase III delta prime subunit